MSILTILVEATPTTCRAENLRKTETYIDSPIIKGKLPTPRELIPISLQGRIEQTKQNLKMKKSNKVECSPDSLCASFDINTTPKDVSAWMGFEFQNNTGKYFIATYGQKAVALGDGTYSTSKWNKKHFWIHLGKNITPFPIQPRFVGIDNVTGKEWYTVDYVGYQMSNEGIDYSTYWENMSQSALILLIDPKTKKVEEYYIEYYDENDEYVGVYSIEIGDKLQSYFLGFRKGQEDREYFFSLEDITTITSKPTFSYEELYPGKDFNTTYGKELKFPELKFKYIFEYYGKTRSNFTNPKPIFREVNTSVNTNTQTNTTKSTIAKTTKSAPLSSFWTLFLLALLITFVKINKKIYEN